MNSVYRVVWNTCRALWMCVSELTSAHRARASCDRTRPPASTPTPITTTLKAQPSICARAVALALSALGTMAMVSPSYGYIVYSTPHEDGWSHENAALLNSMMSSLWGSSFQAGGLVSAVGQPGDTYHGAFAAPTWISQFSTVGGVNNYGLVYEEKFSAESTAPLTIEHGVKLLLRDFGEWGYSYGITLHDDINIWGDVSWDDLRRSPIISLSGYELPFWKLTTNNGGTTVHHRFRLNGEGATLQLQNSASGERQNYVFDWSELEASLGRNMGTIDSNRNPLGTKRTLSEVVRKIAVEANTEFKNPWQETEGHLTLYIGNEGLQIATTAVDLQSNLADQGQVLTLKGNGAISFDGGETLDLRHALDSDATLSFRMMENTVVKGATEDWEMTRQLLSTHSLEVDIDDSTTMLARFNERGKQVYWTRDLDETQLHHLIIQTHNDQTFTPDMINTFGGWRIRMSEGSIRGEAGGTEITQPIWVLDGGILNMPDNMTLSEVRVGKGMLKLANTGTLTKLVINGTGTGGVVWLPLGDALPTINEISFVSSPVGKPLRVLR